MKLPKIKYKVLTWQDNRWLVNSAINLEDARNTWKGSKKIICKIVE